MVLRTIQTTPDKKCTRCKEVKPLDSFSVRKSGKRAGEHLPQCRPCNSRTVIEYHQAHPKNNRDAQQRWRAANPQKVKKYERRARARRVERDPLYHSKQHTKYRDSRLAYMRAHYQPKNTPPRTMGYSAERRREIALIAAAARWGDFKYDALRNAISITEREGFTPLHLIQGMFKNPLAQLIERERISAIVKRLVSERGISEHEARQIVVQHL